MVKINDEIYQTYLTGFAPNGDVKLACFRKKENSIVNNLLSLELC